MDEDIILPDDFQGEPAQPQAGAEENIEGQQGAETTPPPEGEAQGEVKTEGQEAPLTAPQTIKVKFNHQEMELPYEEAVQHIQKGMNYDKTVERLKALESDPRLSFVESQARKYNMTPEAYIEAVKQQEEQEQLNQLIQQNIPEEYAREMLENRKFREQFQEREKAQKEEEAKKAKEEAEFTDFLTNYPDVKPDDIPQAVWDYREETGKSLNEAMLWHENNELKNQLKVLRQNEENSKKAPFSGVTTYGSNETTEEDDFLKGFNSI